jgi:hypothetical protein
MKRPAKTVSQAPVIALALTWDGARWPTRRLPPNARAFLKGTPRTVPASAKAAKLLAGDALKEIRICWLPVLKGGEGALAEPFLTPKGMRMEFHAAKTIQIGDVLGVVYRRSIRNKL